MNELKSALQYADDELGIDVQTASYSEICAALAQQYPEYLFNKITDPANSSEWRLKSADGSTSWGVSKTTDNKLTVSVAGGWDSGGSNVRKVLCLRTYIPKGTILNISGSCGYSSKTIVLGIYGDLNDTGSPYTPLQTLYTHWTGPASFNISNVETTVNGYLGIGVQSSDTTATLFTFDQFNGR